MQSLNKDTPHSAHPLAHDCAVFTPMFLRDRFFLILLITFTLSGCRSVTTSITREIRLNLGAEPATIDPALATDPGSQQIARMLFLSLVDTNATTGAPEHALATAWAVSSDGLIWQFKLRHDAVWVKYQPTRDRLEPMRPVTAEDVVYSIRRIFDPRTGSGFAPIFAPMLRGAQELLATDPKRATPADYQRLFGNLGVQAPDETTVRITLTRPASHLPSVLSVWLARTQPREAVEAGGADWIEPDTVWTNGPYFLERWSHHREIVLKKNPHWYNASKVEIERIRLAMIGNPFTALEQYRAGNLDSLDPFGSLSVNEAESFKDDPTLSKQLHLVPTLCTQYYGFNVNKAPFDDVRVRKAFAAAIDRDALVSSVVRLGESARWFTPPGIFASQEIQESAGNPRTYSASQAREYLRQAGYDRRRMPNITLAVNTNDTHQRVAETLVQMWKINLNVDVRVGALDWSSFLAALREDTPQLFRMGWCGYIPDAANFSASVFRSSSGDNVTKWKDPHFDQLIDTASRETDIARRRSLYQAAEKLLIDDAAVVIPLWWTSRATLSRPHLKRTFSITPGYERFEVWSFQ